MKRHWYLVGLRASGKTTIGNLLAQRLGLPFTDTDDEIQRIAHMTIAQIFATQGEAAFRKVESQVLAQLCASSERVISTGGGIILKPENRRILTSTGNVIWLRASPAVLWQRLQDDPETPHRRPTLLDGGREELETLHRLRAPLYQEVANLIIDVENKSRESVVEEILSSCRRMHS